jgi:hypothetical protein
MPQKSLILYSSRTGNTEKVALRFKKVFEKKGWQCDIFKVDKNIDIENPPFDYRDYDFLCVGSYIDWSLPPDELLFIMRHNPQSAHCLRKPSSKAYGHRRIVIGPKKGIVFITYAGAHLGPKEALPALYLLELEMEHLRFECIGQFSCPGKMFNRPTPGFWHGDISHRPSERDLLKAEIFMEEKIEELH